MDPTVWCSSAVSMVIFVLVSTVWRTDVPFAPLVPVEGHGENVHGYTERSLTHTESQRRYETERNNKTRHETTRDGVKRSKSNGRPRQTAHHRQLQLLSLAVSLSGSLSLSLCARV